MALSAETKVGVFVIVGLALLLTGTLIVEDINPFRQTYELKAYFETVEGLLIGNDVSMAGVRCGKVKDMKILPTQVEVILQIDRNVVIRRDAVATIELQTILGGKKIAISMGDPNEPALKPGAIVKTEEAQALTDVATAAAKKLSDALDENLPRISNILSTAEALTNDLKEGKGPLGKMLKDEELYDDIVATISSLRETSDKGGSILGMLEEKAPKLSQAIDDLAEIVAQVRGGKGTLGGLLYDDEAYQNLVKASRDLKELAQSTKEMLSGRKEDLEAFAAAGPKLLETIQQLQGVLQKIEEGSGTVGLLINDDSLYKDAKALMAEVRGAVQDMRDQVPTASFLGIALTVLK